MSDHTWRFFRAGDFDQVILEDAHDLQALKTLDQKLWVALACPVQGNTLDAKTLSYIDADNDGRIRAPELLAAIDWTALILKDVGSLSQESTLLELGALRQDTPEGKAVYQSAKRILAERSKPEATAIAVEDTLGAHELFNAMPYNGDGVIVPELITDEALRAAAEQVMSTQGQAQDRSGKPGINAEHVNTFFGALADYEAWWTQAETSEDELVPLGDQTAAAVEAYVAIKAKAEDYFMRCDLAAFDPRAKSHLMGKEGQWEAMAAQLLTRKDDAIASFPLAEVVPGQPLPLNDGINPAWAAAMRDFKLKAVEPLLGADTETIDQPQWRQLAARFSAYEAWLAGKKGQSVEGLGIERVRELLASELRAQLEAEIAADEAMRPDADALDAVDKATRLHRDLFTLAQNFVNFKDFYNPNDKAIFQIGTLYLDSRSCELCIRVEDLAKHTSMATQSFTCLVYCDCVRKSTNEKMIIAAAFTNGDSEFLIPGRNGIFYDHLGQDWDATVTKVIEQPISIRQAFWMPYKRLAKFVSDQIEKFASAQDKVAQDKMTTQVNDQSAKLKETTAKANQPAPTAAPAAPPAAAPAAPATPAPAATTPASATPATQQSQGFDMGKYAGIFAAVGLALGFVISAVTMLVTGFMGLKLWQMPLAVVGILLLISGPSMLLAAFKLKQRSLAPLLDANGWAINSRAKIGIRFGATLTKLAQLPEGARRAQDPYQDKKSPIWFYFLLILLVCAAAVLWDMGFIPKWLGLDAKPEISAPAPTPAPAPPAPATPAAKPAP